ncbi:hypothetical protein ACFYMI_20520 [Streptomyces collinus]|uniref:hypothetical protein n=1 Tax=Streptomyces collinus TaxID=42684 RepID=UPI0036BDEB70
MASSAVAYRARGGRTVEGIGGRGPATSRTRGIVSDVRIVSARLNDIRHDAGVRLLSDARTASLLETRWTTRVKRRSGDRLDLGRR